MSSFRLPNPFRDAASPPSLDNEQQDSETAGLLSDNSTSSLSVRLRDTRTSAHNNNNNADDLLSIIRDLQQDVQFIKQRMQGSEGTMFLTPRKRNPILKPWLTNNLLLITFLWQIANVILLTFIAHNSDMVTVGVSIGIMIFFQSLHVVFIIFISIKLVKQLLHKHASGWFLIQSHLSTILLFAGIYMLIFRIQSSSFTNMDHINFEDKWDMFRLWVRFLYFSTTTFSTVGYGDIAPTLWYGELVAMVQMLLSTLYNVVIFAKGLAHFASSSPSVPGASKV